MSDIHTEWRVRYRTWHRTPSGKRIDDNLSMGADNEEFALRIAEALAWADAVVIERRAVSDWEPVTVQPPQRTPADH